MKKVTKEVLVDAATRLLFKMTDEQYAILLSEFDILIKQMEFIGKIPNIDTVTPMTFPFEVSTSALREDIPSKPLTQNEALQNAGSKVAGQIKLPKVI